MRTLGKRAPFLLTCLLLWTAGFGSEVDSLLGALSLPEKIGQMILVYHPPPAFVLERHLGGVLVMANSLRKPEILKAQIDTIQTKGRVGILVAADQEGGKINRLQFMPRWKKTPSALELSGWPTDSISAHTREVGETLRSLRINVNLAPVLDPTHDWKGAPTFPHAWGRAFGASSDQIIGPALAAIAGFRQSGILCVSKHFPGYDVAGNSDLVPTVSEADSAAVRRNIRIFTEAQPHLGGVMMSSIHYAKLDGRPAVLSPELVALARGADSNFLVFTDDLWGTALRQFASPGDSVHPSRYPDEKFARLVEMAFWAGNDILMITFPEKTDGIIKTIGNLVKTDPKAERRLHQSCRRILLAKRKMGLLRRPGAAE